ncbi:DUF7344 domain-containing protein [Halovivax limisalsi]|uniref:DUF7344 domain-containing protein n=1 Tax=Halovivax limisalsi TaxID=1453760 RepID=UPI001FFC6945|nr:hypothetical protein [Halovivax limisalsi]
MTTNIASDPLDTSDVLTALSNECCRAVVAYGREHDASTVTFSALSHAASRLTSLDPPQIDVQLHHSALPRLDDLGLVEYDYDARTVRFRDHPVLESDLLERAVADQRL